jgi:hypothetical protein
MSALVNLGCKKRAEKTFPYSDELQTRASVSNSNCDWRGMKNNRRYCAKCRNVGDMEALGLGNGYLGLWYEKYVTKKYKAFIAKEIGHCFDNKMIFKNEA